MLKSLPEGKLCCVNNGKYCRWHVNQSGTLFYLPKSEEKLAKQLAYRKYLTALRKDLVEESRVSSQYVKKLSPPSKTESLLLNSPEINRLTSSYFTPLNQELAEWSKAPYEKNPSFQEGLVHKSISGNMLRSKSEVLIDMLLYQAKIPYRYECQLVLGNDIFYPDFKIRHPLNGKRYYWEHFGQMDNPEYYPKACKKIQTYTSYGIIPSINLITPFETKDSPLTSDVVSKIIEHYFL